MAQREAATPEAAASARPHHPHRLPPCPPRPPPHSLPHPPRCSAHPAARVVAAPLVVAVAPLRRRAGRGWLGRLRGRGRRLGEVLGGERDEQRRQKLHPVDNLFDDVDWRTLARIHLHSCRITVKPHAELDVIGHHACLEKRTAQEECVVEERLHDLALIHRCRSLHAQLAPMRRLQPTQQNTHQPDSRPRWWDTVDVHTSQRLDDHWYSPRAGTEGRQRWG